VDSRLTVSLLVANLALLAGLLLLVGWLLWRTRRRSRPQPVVPAAVPEQLTGVQREIKNGVEVLSAQQGEHATTHLAELHKVVTAAERARAAADNSSNRVDRFERDLDLVVSFLDRRLPDPGPSRDRYTLGPPTA
jgi:Flp pilus assembly protein TadB